LFSCTPSFAKTAWRVHTIQQWSSKSLGTFCPIEPYAYDLFTHKVLPRLNTYPWPKGRSYRCDTERCSYSTKIESDSVFLDMVLERCMMFRGKIVVYYSEKEFDKGCSVSG